ncbi:glycosyltransferase family 4 protein, partial [Spirochaeta dissipatitropha]
MMHVVPAFLSAFFLNLAITPVVIAVARRRGWYDEPGERTVHTVPVPRLGGVGFVFSILAVGLVISIAYKLQLSPRFGFVVAGLVMFHLVGLADDFMQFRAVIKLAGQLCASVLLIAGGMVISRIAVPFSDSVISLGALGPILTLVWIAAISNAVNLMDGLDGLAGGIAIIAFGCMAVFFGLQDIYPEFLFLMVSIGALLAFLYYNRPKAVIFMGDGGSLWLGALVAILPLMGGDRSLFSSNAFLAPTLA